MSNESLLEELADLHRRRDSIPPDEGEAWVERVSEILHRLAPERGRDFDRETPLLFAGLSSLSLGPAWARVKGIVRRALAEIEAETASSSSTSEPVGAEAGLSMTNSHPDPAVVFVVHGRNEALRRGLFDFLRALHLRPLEWSDALKATGKAAPYIGEVLDSAFAEAQAVVVLLSPDDEVRLTETLRTDDEDPAESQLLLQARPNVLFEAGLAFGSHPNRTVLVQVGRVKPFSDIAGRHVIRLDNSSERRTDLADRLDTAGCAVVRTGRDWLSTGDFAVSTSGPSYEEGETHGSSPHSALSVELTARSRGERRIVVKNVGNTPASDISLLADGAPLEQHEVWVSNQDWPTSLRPGEQFSVTIALAMGSPVRADVRVEWTDPHGASHHFDKMLQFL